MRHPTISVPCPIVHMNGTSKAALLAENMTALTAVQAALAACCAAAPNARDYYPHANPNFFSIAQESHRARIEMLTTLKGEYEAIALSLID
jgi:hypothetical protein